MNFVAVTLVLCMAMWNKTGLCVTVSWVSYCCCLLRGLTFLECCISNCLDWWKEEEQAYNMHFWWEPKGTVVVVMSSYDQGKELSSPYQTQANWVYCWFLVPLHLWSWDVLEICFGAGKGGYGSLQLEAQKGWCDGACIKGKIWIHAVFIGSCMINLGIALFGCKLMQTS